jgi:hypothetical protein
MVVVVTIIVRDYIVASEINGMSTRNFEENALILGDGDIKWLLEVLYCVSL